METILKLNILALVITLILSSCFTSVTEATRRIINETNKQLAFEVYADDISFSYEMFAFDTLDIQGTCEFGEGADYCHLGWNVLDFGEIIFIDNKQLFFDLQELECSEKAINAEPNNRCHGYTGFFGEDFTIYTYRITEEDYENAE